MSETSLPDFDDMALIVEEISAIVERKLVIEAELDTKAALIVLEATTNPARMINGKTPSMEFVKNGWMVTGFDGELIPLRLELASVTARVEEKRNMLQLLFRKLDVWRTEQADRRIAV